MKYSVFLFLLLAYALTLNAQKNYTPNGYYITSKGDTVHSQLRIKDSMYLISKNPKGKRKSLTPSKVREVHIISRTYMPLYLKEFDKMRFVSVRIKGHCSLYVYEDAFKNGNVAPGLGVGPALVVGATQGSFMASNSGAYIMFQGDEHLYSVPSSHKLFDKFIVKHFESEEKIISRLDEEWEEMIPFLADLILEYNKGSEK